MTQARQQLGLHGEQLACDELERRGYVIIARRYRSIAARQLSFDLVNEPSRCTREEHERVMAWRPEPGPPFRLNPGGYSLLLAFCIAS